LNDICINRHQGKLVLRKSAAKRLPQEILKQLLPDTFRLTYDQRIRMLGSFVRKKIDMKSSHDDLRSLFCEFAGDFIGAMGDLGQNRDGDQIRSYVKVKILDGFIDDAHVKKIIRIRGQKGQVKFGNGRYPSTA